MNRGWPTSSHAAEIDSGIAISNNLAWQHRKVRPLHCGFPARRCTQPRLAASTAGLQQLFQQQLQFRSLQSLASPPIPAPATSPRVLRKPPGGPNIPRDQSVAVRVAESSERTLDAPRLSNLTPPAPLKFHRVRKRQPQAVLIRTTCSTAG